MEKTGRAIIFVSNTNNEKFYSIKRTKIKNGNKNIYYTIPGGHLEDKESYEEATLREIKEELGIDIKIKEELISLFNEDLKRQETFFIADYISGEIGTGDGEEWSGNDEKYGKYEIVELEIKNLNRYNLLPIEVKNLLIENNK